MSIRHTLLCASLITLANVVTPVVANADYDVDITTAPPPPKEETTPEPRTGYIWSPGYWAWNDHIKQHEWVNGHWIAQREGQHWVPDKWTQDPNNPNHWHFTSGHWES